MLCSSGRVRNLVTLLVCAIALASAQASTAHDRTFWKSIAQQHYAVPENESAGSLVHELSTMLGSPDPELRDELAYSILAEWIARPNIVPEAELIKLADEWRANLKVGIGEAGTDSVLKRSFSALCLASIAERDAKTPFLGAARYHQLVADAVSYLQAERDVHDYDAAKGWAHAAAHTADLLQALANSPLLTRAEEDSILAAIADRLESTPQVYTQGEQDRLAQAVLAVIRRPDFESARFDSWLESMRKQDRKVWANRLTPESLALYQNHTYMFEALVVRLSLETPSPKVERFRTQMLDVLRTR